MQEHTLKGKVALITGGSRGLGAHTAQAMAALGADIAISYLHAAEQAHALVKQLEKPKACVPWPFRAIKQIPVQPKLWWTK